MKKIQLCLLICTAFFATGCPKYRPKVDFNNKSSLVNRINARFTDWQVQYRSALDRRDFERAKTVRNELLEEALPYLDDAYIDFINDIQRGRDRGNFVADVIELGTSGAIGITNGERGIQILGVALTAFRGGRRSADLNFYKDQSTPILISKMDGNRATVRATILTREKGSVADYPIGAAISDIVDYYNAGTLVRAFTQLQQDTAVITKQSEDKVLELKGVPITKEATQVFAGLSKSAGNVITELDVALAGTDSAKKDAATRRLQKIVAALEKDKDAAAVLKNAGVSSKDDGLKLINALIDIRAAASMVNNNALLDTINQAIVENR
jgi:hypothetical protein